MMMCFVGVIRFENNIVFRFLRTVCLGKRAEMATSSLMSKIYEAFNCIQEADSRSVY